MQRKGSSNSPDSPAPPSSACFPACCWTSRHSTLLLKALWAQRTLRRPICRSAPLYVGRRTEFLAPFSKGVAAGVTGSWRNLWFLLPALVETASSGCDWEKTARGWACEGRLQLCLGASEGLHVWILLRLEAPEKVTATRKAFKHERYSAKGRKESYPIRGH